METAKYLLELHIDNDLECVQSLTWLRECVDKRRAKGKPVTVEHLAECSTMRKVIARGAKLVRTLEGRFVSNDEKRDTRYKYADNIINYC